MAEIKFTIKIDKDIMRGGYVVNAKSKYLKLTKAVHDSMTFQDEKTSMICPFYLHDDYVCDGRIDDAIKAELAEHICLYFAEVIQSVDITAPDLADIQQGSVEAFSVAYRQNWKDDITEK
jgi:hypothetical protein